MSKCAACIHLVIVTSQIQDVPTDTCLIANIDEYVRTCILLFNEVLWFVMSLDHYLINANQMHMEIIPVSYDPIDNSRKLGITYEKVFISFVNYGTKVFFIQEFQTNVKSQIVLTLS